MHTHEALSRMAEQSLSAMRNRMASEHVKHDLNVALDVVFAGARIGPIEFLPFYRDILVKSGAFPPPERFYQHALRMWCVLKYAYHALTNEAPGGWLICASSGGATPIALLELAKRLIPGFEGQNVLALDFSGTTMDLVDEDVALELDPTTRDVREILQPSLCRATNQFINELRERHPQMIVTRTAIQNVDINQGWSWSFAFIDVDNFHLTKHCLKLMHPSILVGGLAIVQEFESLLAPGVRQAVVEFCDATDNVAYGALDSGQAVLCKAVN